MRSNRWEVRLDTGGHEPNVNVQFEDVAKVFGQHLSGRLADLLEVAAYVYTADCATRRGEAWADDDTEEPWGRDLALAVPVRDLEFWQRGDVQHALIRTLAFLSDDRWSFRFCQQKRTRVVQGYLEFGEQQEWPFQGVERVLMFSGGLDSLAGAVETAAAGKPLVLVSHRPVSTIYARQRALTVKLGEIYRDALLHIPVWLNKDVNLGRETTQRTRSFLYASLGAIIGESVRAEGVRFFENGVVSLNLPVADEVVRARASRTTNPRVLDLLAQFFGLVLGREFAVDNPFLFRTKADVVSTIARHGHAPLIALSRSCSHGRFIAKNQWHCGTCSQCIDRRVAVVAAAQEEHDLGIDYTTDVFIGPRKDGYERNMAVDYARHALVLHTMSEEAVASRFNLEITRAVRSQPKRAEAAQQLVELHKRHAATVMDVLERQLHRHAKALTEAALPATSLLALVAGQEHRTSTWVRFAERLARVLQIGVPSACEKDPPKDEPHLQRICDGILKSHDLDLVREHPFLGWASVFTKPDWSDESRTLWLELKYVRDRPQVRRITEEIAADITKYGDNQRRVLFVVYDPKHLVKDERRFSEEIERRPTMMVRFIR